MIDTDVLIIGAGPVGLFAVFQAGMLGMRSHVVDNLEVIGGQCIALYPEKPIYDIPAFAEIKAEDLIKNLEKQIERFKPVYHLSQCVVEVKNKGDKFYSTTSLGTKIQSKIVIIAAGSGSFVPNRPPLENLYEYEDKSVFYMVKNREVFRGKKVAIAGGGDSAVDWAINLSDIAKKIYLIHRREKFRAAEDSLKQIAALVSKGKIEMVIPYQLREIDGSNGIMQNIIVADLNNNEKKLEADMLLPLFGLATDLGPIKNWGLEFEHYGIKVNQSSSETNIEGIYAVGDVSYYPGKVKLILIGFSEVSIALHHAYSRVFNGRALHFEYSTTKGAGGL